MIAALFVETDGVYFNLPGVDPWDRERDARRYAGPHAVVAHPPCERWGRYWFGNPTLAARGIRFKLGDDNGCFAAALAAVRRHGGVLEHPEASHAWRAFGISALPRSGGWIDAGDGCGMTCCVEQGNYGHAARKATWLYYVGPKPPELKWGRALGDFLRIDQGYHTAEERRQAKATGRHQPARQLPTSLRARTPLPFRDLLIGLARGVDAWAEQQAALL